MRKAERILAYLTALLLVLTGCGGKSEAVAADCTAAGNLAVNYDVGPSAEIEYSKTEEYGVFESYNNIYLNPGTKLIRRAEITVQTTGFEQAAKELEQMIRECNGYFETASVFGGNYRDAHADRRGEYIVRIPGEKFDEFLGAAGNLGYVTRSFKSSEDVGEQYFDTESRLKTQRTKQERLLKLLEQAATMEDIINLENALSEVEYTIEQLSSTLNRYDALISYSTITVYLNEVSKVTEEIGETSSLWQRITAGLSASVSGLVEGAKNVLVWMSYHVFALGLLVSTALVGVLIGKHFWRRRKRHAAEEEKTSKS